MSERFHRLQVGDRVSWRDRGLSFEGNVVGLWGRGLNRQVNVRLDGGALQRRYVRDLERLVVPRKAPDSKPTLEDLSGTVNRLRIYAEAMAQLFSSAAYRLADGEREAALEDLRRAASDYSGLFMGWLDEIIADVERAAPHTEPDAAEVTLADPCPHPARRGVHEEYSIHGVAVCRACGAKERT